MEEGNGIGIEQEQNCSIYIPPLTHVQAVPARSSLMPSIVESVIFLQVFVRC